MDRAIAVTNYSDLNEYNKLELKKKKKKAKPTLCAHIKVKHGHGYLSVVI